MERHHPEAACQLFTVPSAIWCAIHSTAQQTASHGVICSVRHRGALVPLLCGVSKVPDI